MALEGKTAGITGGASGIGAASARRDEAAGADLRVDHGPEVGPVA